MADESPAQRPHTGLPLAPRLQRSTRLRRALNLQRPVNPPTSRAEPPQRLKFGGNFFAFISAQVLIAVVAFVLEAGTAPHDHISVSSTRDSCMTVESPFS